MLFGPPKDVPTSIFATLPPEFRIAAVGNEWVRGQPGACPARSLLEGPSFDKDGNLWCVDIPNGQVFRISPGGDFTLVAEYDGWPNGLKFHKDGRIFIADYKNGIMEMDPVTGVVRPFLVRANLERFKAVNDLFFAANGDLYFTDQGLTGLHDPTGRVFRVTPDGRVTCLLGNVPSPNGVVMNLDETILYVAVTRGNCVWRLPIYAGWHHRKGRSVCATFGGLRRPGRAGPGRAGAASDRACRHGLGLDCRPTRRAGVSRT